MKIYVCAHKKVDSILPKNYEYIQANSSNNSPIYELRDNMGDNISKKNPYYCELTIAYWIWKNDKENDIVGLAHYRRFLTTNKFSSSPKKYINSPKIEKLLQNYDFIATKLYKTQNTVKEHLLINVFPHDYDLLEETIKEVCPDYLDSFNTIMNGHESHLLNMFISKKEEWDKYYTWLFNIFDKLEPKVNMDGYTVQQQRLYGFLSERLFSVYALKNNKKIYSLPTHIVGESIFKTAFNKIKRLLHIKSSD